MYDFLIIGSGLFGCTFANLAKQNNHKCLILEKKDHAFGNCFTQKVNNIHIHKYGPHIFHTNSLKIWNYINQFSNFNNYVNRPKVIYNNKIFSFPINLMTLYQLWGINNPYEAKEKLESVKVKYSYEPQNLEEWILSQVGEEIYYTFIYGYTKKQWNTEPKNLPSFIIKRLPIRFNFNDNYFFDTFQGIPTEGYSQLMDNMIEGIEMLLNTDYFSKRDYWDSIAKTIVYTGPIDEFFNKQFGELGYRSLRFENETHEINDFQGNAIINYTNYDISYTRTIEHKHFTLGDDQNITIVTKEYPEDYTGLNDKYYPINNTLNNQLYNQYHQLSNNLSKKYIFGGRLAEYRYYDMHQVIGSAFNIYDKYTRNIDSLTNQ